MILLEELDSGGFGRHSLKFRAIERKAGEGGADQMSQLRFLRKQLLI